MEESKKLAEIIGSGARVIITTVAGEESKRTWLGRIIKYDALNQKISIQQDDNSICVLPLSSISSLEVMRNPQQRKS